MANDLKKETHRDYTAWDLNVPQIVTVKNRQKLEHMFKRKARRKMRAELQEEAMKIKRTFDNREIEIELTENELWRAYDERQHRFDMDDIEMVFDGLTDEQLINAFGYTRKELEEMYETMAYRLRKNMDKYDMPWSYARDDAIDSVIAERKGNNV